MNEEKFGLSDEKTFSLDDNEYHSIFLFVKFVLDMLGRVSQVFQQRYLMILEAWNIVDSLKKRVFNIITNIQSSSPTSFDFLSGIERDQVERYSTRLQQLLQGISLRFPCPSSSHDMRNMGSSLFVEFDPVTIEHNPFERQCSLLNIL